MPTKKPAAKPAAKCAAKCAAKPAAKPAAKKAAKIVVPTTKAGILADIAGKAGITNAQAKLAYDALLSIVYAGAKAPAGITLPGLGKFSIGKRAARTGRNPSTGATIKIPAAKVAKFKFVKAAKDGIL